MAVIKQSITMIYHDLHLVIDRFGVSRKAGNRALSVQNRLALIEERTRAFLHEHNLQFTDLADYISDKRGSCTG